MSLTQPKWRTSSSTLNVWFSTIAIVMYVRTFSFGLLTTPMYGETPRNGRATRTKKARIHRRSRRLSRTFIESPAMLAPGCTNRDTRSASHDDARGGDLDLPGQHGIFEKLHPLWELAGELSPVCPARQVRHRPMRGM